MYQSIQGIKAFVFDCKLTHLVRLIILYQLHICSMTENWLLYCMCRFVHYQGKDVEKPDFFSPAQRSRMVHEVLLRARYGMSEQEFG